MFSYGAVGQVEHTEGLWTPPGVSLEFLLLKSKTRWDGTMEMSWEVISQETHFLWAIMSQGLVRASQSSSSWSLNQSLEGKSAKNLDGEICSEGSSSWCRCFLENLVPSQAYSYTKTHMFIVCWHFCICYFLLPCPMFFLPVEIINTLKLKIHFFSFCQIMAHILLLIHYLTLCQTKPVKGNIIENEFWEAG